MISSSFHLCANIDIIVHFVDDNRLVRYVDKEVDDSIFLEFLVDLALFVLDDAHTAGAEGGQLRIVAEGGHIDAGLANQLQNILFALDEHRDLIDQHYVLIHGLFLPDSAEGTVGDTGTALDTLGDIDDIRLADLAGDGVHRAVTCTLRAADTFIR